MTVLAPELEQRVQQQIAQGTYQSADEVLSEALDALERRNADFGAFRDELNAKLDASAAAAERGEFVFDGELEAELEVWASSVSQK